MVYRISSDNAMIIRDIAETPYERVIDRSLLCELLHPDKIQGVEDLGCSVAHAIVPPGNSTLPHRLRKSTELYYILQGSGVVNIEQEHSAVRPGQIILIPVGASQYISNTGTEDLEFLCIVIPKWRAEDEELTR